MKEKGEERVSVEPSEFIKEEGKEAPETEDKGKTPVEPTEPESAVVNESIFSEDSKDKGAYDHLEPSPVRKESTADLKTLVNHILADNVLTTAQKARFLTTIREQMAEIDEINLFERETDPDVKSARAMLLTLGRPFNSLTDKEIKEALDRTKKRGEMRVHSRNDFTNEQIVDNAITAIVEYEKLKVENKEEKSPVEDKKPAEKPKCGKSSFRSFLRGKASPCLIIGKMNIKKGELFRLKQSILPPNPPNKYIFLLASYKKKFVES